MYYAVLEVLLAKLSFIYQQNQGPTENFQEPSDYFRELTDITFRNPKMINDFPVRSHERSASSQLTLTSVSGMPANPGMVLPH